MARYFGIHTLEGEWHSLLPRYVLLSDRVQGKRILDIGCGTGIGSSLLLELGAEQVNAVDHRPAVLELARVKHAKEGLDFHVMFWEELDFADDSFDMVLCLDPSSPVTDPSLLLEIKRVLTPGGEYVCAIERRTIEGIDSLLPRYGYNEGGENVEMVRTRDRVPQIGELGQFFETVVPIIQRPRYSFVFDYSSKGENGDPHLMRKVSPQTDESGLWVGDDPQQSSAEHTDQRPGRWIGTEDSLCDRDGDPASVEVLFCGDGHMPPPVLREVQMPYLGLVERLHQIISDLQIRQHPGSTSTTFAEVVDNTPPRNDFSERENTSEFMPISHWAESSGANRGQNFPGQQGLDQIRHQLEEMTHLYQQVRSDMEHLFTRTRQELAQRDHYIEHLVDTVHRWQHKIDENGVAPAPVDAYDAETTSVFTRPTLDGPSESAPATDSGEMEADSEVEESDQPQPPDSDAEESSAADDSSEVSESSERSEPQEDSENDVAKALADDDSDPKTREFTGAQEDPEEEGANSD